MRDGPSAEACAHLGTATEREYRVVDSLDELDEPVFKSLSAATRHITGTHTGTQWNGPEFFRLRILDHPRHVMVAFGAAADW